MKACTKCHESKPVAQFPLRPKGRDGRDSRCRACITVSRRLWSRANKAHERTTYREWRANNLEYDRTRSREYQREHRVESWERYIKRVHKITGADWTAFLIAQSGRCAICLCGLTNPQVDHCHTTHKLRGLLCRPCNMALGLLQEDQLRLRRAIDYIGAAFHESKGTRR